MLVQLNSGVVLNTAQFASFRSDGNTLWAANSAGTEKSYSDPGAVAFNKIVAAAQ